MLAEVGPADQVVTGQLVTGLDVAEIRKLFPDVCDALGKPVVPNRLLRAVRNCVGDDAEGFGGIARGCA